jgi:cytochrome c5
MRKIILPVFLALGAAILAGGAALSQPPAAVTPAQAGAAELSEEDRTADPFPPGRHAGLVKRVCTECHRASLILDIQYTREDAERYYKNMVSEDLTTDQAQQIIEYLTTTLGVKE